MHLPPAIHIRDIFMDMLFPRSCMACGARIPEEEPGEICWDCRADISYVQPPFCERCGDPVFGVLPETFVCNWCAQHAPAFDWARSAIRYRGVGKQSLGILKYRDGWWLQRDLSQFLLSLCRTAPPDLMEATAVTAVPLHFLRERKRGYNQAALLAEILARHLGLPFWRDALVRSQKTNTQTTLTANQRRKNVAGVFTACRKRRLKDATIVLVDDVMTTGATVNECAKTLKAAGASRIFVMTVARGG